jgi:hypothetical protein
LENIESKMSCDKTLIDLKLKIEKKSEKEVKKN